MSDSVGGDERFKVCDVSLLELFLLKVPHVVL